MAANAGGAATMTTTLDGHDRTSDRTGQFAAKLTSLCECLEPMIPSNYFRLVNTMPHSASAAPAAW